MLCRRLSPPLLHCETFQVQFAIAYTSIYLFPRRSAGSQISQPQDAFEPGIWKEQELPVLNQVGSGFSPNTQQDLGCPLRYFFKRCCSGAFLEAKPDTLPSAQNHAPQHLSGQGTNLGAKPALTPCLHFHPSHFGGGCPKSPGLGPISAGC